MDALSKHRHTGALRIATALLLGCLMICLLASCSGGSGGGSDPEAYGEETFKGTTWTASDGSELVFQEDGILSWWREEGNHDGDVFQGPYVAHRGQAAYDFVVDDLSDYGVTAEELDRILASGDSDRELNDLVVFTLDHQTVIMDGKSYTFDDPVVPYYGFLNDDASAMEVVNMRTATVYHFTKK